MILEAKNIGFYYSENQWLFRNLSMTIIPGEIVGLYGQSGQGKTTLGRILAGYEKPIEGKVLINGEELTENAYHPVQLIHQHPEKTINPRWPMEKVINEGWIVSKELKEKLGIKDHWLARYPNEISGGEQQRSVIARALGPKTKFLIADEITTMLDAVTQVEIWDTLLKEAKRRKIGMLIISHDQALLTELTDRVINLNESFGRKDLSENKK